MLQLNMIMKTKTKKTKNNHYKNNSKTRVYKNSGFFYII